MSDPKNAHTESGVSFEFLIGAALAIAGSLLSNFGVNVQKYSLMNNGSLSSEVQKPYFRQPLWLVGFLCVVFGSIGDLIALKFAAQSVVAPLSAVTLVSNIAFAHWGLGEALTRRDVVGTALVILGGIVSVSFGDHSVQKFSLDDLKLLFIEPLFVAYGFGVAGLIVVLYLTLKFHIEPTYEAIMDELDRGVDHPDELFSTRTRDQQEAYDDANPGSSALGRKVSLAPLPGHSSPLSDQTSGSEPLDTSTSSEGLERALWPHGRGQASQRAPLVKGSPESQGSDSSSDSSSPLALDLRQIGDSAHDHTPTAIGGFSGSRGAGRGAAAASRTKGSFARLPRSAAGEFAAPLDPDIEESDLTPLSPRVPPSDGDSLGPDSDRGARAGRWACSLVHRLIESLYRPAVWLGDQLLRRNRGSISRSQYLATLRLRYKPFEKLHPFSYCALSGLFGGQSLLFAKSSILMITNTFTGDNQFGDPLAWILVAAMFLSIFSQIHFLALALRNFDAMYVVPVFQTVFISTSALGGIFYFREFEAFGSTQAVLFPLGLLVTLFGVWLLSSSRGPSFDLDEEISLGDVESGDQLASSIGRERGGGMGVGRGSDHRRGSLSRPRVPASLNHMDGSSMVFPIASPFMGGALHKPAAATDFSEWPERDRPIRSSV